MNRLIVMLFGAAALLWGGCSKDAGADEKTAGLVGTWELAKSYDMEYDEWDYDYGTAAGYVCRMEFREDGTCTFRERDFEEDTQWDRSDGFYTLNGKVLTMYYEFGSDPDDCDTEVYRVEKLTRQELVLVRDYEGMGNQRYATRYYYERME